MEADPLRLIVCARCGVEAVRYARGKKTPFCRPCSMERIRESGSAHGKVCSAIRKGELPKPSLLPCSDCGAPADQYDHRDYSRPLDVHPVCRPCNHKRGPAFDRLFRPHA